MINLEETRNKTIETQCNIFLNFTVVIVFGNWFKHENCFLLFVSVISPTRSSTQSTCTDTLSVSSTDYEEREPTVHIQSAWASSKEALNSEKAKQVCISKW